MAQYLLDTDICIELFKHNERVIDKVEAIGEENCFITDITIAELFYGAAKWAALLILMMLITSCNCSVSSH